MFCCQDQLCSSTVGLFYLYAYFNIVILKMKWASNNISYKSIFYTKYQVQKQKRSAILSSIADIVRIIDFIALQKLNKQQKEKSVLLYVQVMCHMIICLPLKRHILQTKWFTLNVTVQRKLRLSWRIRIYNRKKW